MPLAIQVFVICAVTYMAVTSVRTYPGPAPADRSRWAVVTVIMVISSLILLGLVGMFPGFRSAG